MSPRPSRATTRAALASLSCGALLASCVALSAQDQEAPPPPAKVPPGLVPEAGPPVESPGRGFSIEIHVDEPAGVARTKAPATASLPFPREAALMGPHDVSLQDDAGATVPCQARVLARWGGKPDDATKPIRWLLLAFEADLGAHKTRAYRLVRRPGEARPERPSSVETTERGCVLETGAVRVKLGGSSPIESIAYEGGEPACRALASVKTPGELATAGAPEKIEVLERGPVRALVRLTGRYRSASGASPLGYALTVEGWAGRSELALSLETRNSDPATVRTVELESLALRLERTGGGALPEAAAARAAQASRDGDALTLELVPAQKEGEKTPLRLRWLGDLQHRTDSVLVFPGKDTSGLVTGWRSPLVGQPSASWVRDTSGFLGPLADEEDERSAYGECALEPAKSRAAPFVAARPDASVGDVNVKWDTESDEARDLLVRFVRTGERGAFDEARAWVDFYRDRYAPRTDGFSFEDAESRRKGTPLENVEVEKHLSVSRLKESHVYGEGLVGHYLLTGEVASLEAAEDMGKLALARFSKLAPEDPIVEMRVFARPMQLVSALLEVTGDEKWRELLARMTACAFASRTRDRERGGYAFKLYVGDFDLDSILPAGFQLPDRFPKDAASGLFRTGARHLYVKGERAAFPYQDRELAHALARAFETTRDERARQALLGLASFYLEEGLVPVFFRSEIVLTPYFVLPYVPEPEVARYPQPSSPIYTTNLGLVEAAAYLTSGDERFLEQAKRCLRIAALRGHGDTRAIARDERRIRIPTVIQWAHGWDDTRTFLALGKRALSKAPPAVTDLVAQKAAKPGTVELRFTVPAGARRFLVQASPRPIVERGGDGKTSSSVFGCEPLLVAEAGSGKTARFIVAADPDARFFVVRSEGDNGFLSALSNVAGKP